MFGLAAMKNLRILAEEVAKIYNEKRAPEANLEIINVDETNSSVIVRITGSFCRTCGVDDWIVDYQYELKEKGIDAKLEDYYIDYEKEEAIAKFVVLGTKEND